MMITSNRPAPTSGKWFCAIPMNYSETGGFWDRDTGLVCEGFRKLGMDSKFVVLGQPAQREDVPLILCTLAQMEDANWWRQWNLKSVLLCAWALPQFEPIARAIKDAGVTLSLLLDSNGCVHPRVWPWRYLQEKYFSERDRTKWFPGGWALLKTFIAFFSARHAGTLRHLEHGDFLILPSPLALQHYRHFLVILGRQDLAMRLRFVPYAVTEDMLYKPAVRKERLIVAVGRWQTYQKGTPVLVRVLQRVLAEQPEYSALVIGGGEEFVQRLVKPLNENLKSRIHILGRVNHEQLNLHYQKSQILLCSSHHESFHIASGEALCCGCSVVGDVRIPSMPYFCSASSGTLSCNLSVNNLGNALNAEIDAWQRGERDPVQISASWVARLHPQRVAEAFSKLV